MSDEAWKGEPEPRGFFVSMFGRPMTAEERAEFDRRVAEETARGNMLYDTLPAFSPAAICRKCGCRKVRVAYCGTARREAHDCRKDAGEREHMHRNCRRCQYEWIEKCLHPEDA